MECPIGLGKVHCQNCRFRRGSKCDYHKVMKEMEVAATRARKLTMRK